MNTEARLSKIKLPAVLALLLIPCFLQAYDEVKVEKIITLADRTIVPSLLRIDKENQWWTVNAEDNGLLRISDKGIVSYRFPSGKKGLFRKPTDFDFSSDGSMVLVDGDLGKVFVFSGSPSEKSTEAKLDWSKSKPTTQFAVEEPASVAVSHDDIIAIGYENQSGVDIFSIDGVLLHRLFIPEKYGAKKIGALAFAQNGTLWALETDKGQLHRFGADRKWLGVTESLEDAKGVSVDEFGFAYVTLGKGRWKEIAPDGSLSGTFGTKGKNPGEMLNPVGIANPDPFHVLVSESGNKRLQLYVLTNREKTKVLRQEPAAFIQVRNVSAWEDHVDAALLGPTDDILLLRLGKDVEWVGGDGQTKSTWKKKGKDKTKLLRPVFFTRDAEQKIWATDQGDHTIKSVSDTGDVLNSVGQKGSKEGNLKGPTFLCVRKDGSFVVADKDNTRVQVLSPNGLFLYALGPIGKREGQLSSVGGLAVNEELIVVLDDRRKALLFYSPMGKFQFEVANKEGKAPFWTDPISLAADNDGRFYLLDRGSRRIRIFNKKGQYLADFSTSGDFITCGPNNHVLVLSEKMASVYSVHLVPKAVSNFSGADEMGDIKLSWDLSPEAITYNLYRSVNSGPFELYTKDVPHPFLDTKLKPSSVYNYGVTGVNKLGYEGSWAISSPIKASKRKDVSLITIEKTNFDPVFTAAFKYYVGTPIGQIEIKNNDEISHRNIKLSVFLSRYTDFPTEVSVETLGAGESRLVPITMTLNDQVLELTEDTPVQAEVRVSYFEDNEEKKISLNAPLTLYSRNAISWGDKARIASFITPRDTPVVEFARDAIRSFLSSLKGSTVGKPLAKAALFYEALNALNISYVPDPKTPFQDVSGKPDAIDYVQFPRETLRRKTGDCDDMTSLMAALLESVGVQVALVDVPGHIFLMANMEESDPSIIGLPIERFVEYKGTYWVPIEMTQLGKNFLAAWQSGSAKIKAAQEKGQMEFIPVQQSFKRYPPVTLVQADPDRPAFPEAAVQKNFPSILDQLQKERYETLLKDMNTAIAADPVNHMLQVQLGMIHVEGKKMAEAHQLFMKLSSADQPIDVQAAAANNLGNMAYLEADYHGAEKFYKEAAKMAPDDAGVLVNQGRTSWRLGDNASARKYFSEAKSKSAQWREYATDVPAEILPE